MLTCYTFEYLMENQTLTQWHLRMKLKSSHLMTSWNFLCRHGQVSQWIPSQCHHSVFWLWCSTHGPCQLLAAIIRYHSFFAFRYFATMLNPSWRRARDSKHSSLAQKLNVPSATFIVGCKILVTEAIHSSQSSSSACLWMMLINISRCWSQRLFMELYTFA